MLAGDLLGQRAQTVADKPALLFAPTGESFTYQELNEMSSRIAHVWTHELGLRKGDRVGILGHNSPTVVGAFFAAGKTGCVIVPLSPRQTPVEWTRIAVDAGLTAIMFDLEFASMLDTLRQELPAVAFVSLYRPDWEKRNFESDHRSFRNVRCDPEDLYALLYTSGTTGKPKGVMIPHRMVIWNAYNTAVSWQLQSDDILAIILPLCHAGGLTVLLTPGILLGCKLVLHNRFSPTEIWRTIAKERVSILMAVPTMLSQLSKVEEFCTVDITSVKWFISGGAPLPAAVAETYKAKGLLLKQGYGLTEVGVNCFLIGNDDAKRKHASIGKPLLFTEARCVNSIGKEARSNEVGELLLRGPHVCQGYWNDSEASQRAIDPDGWFHTGDNIRVDDDGFYYVMGRIKEMYISGGLKVCPVEIECEMLLHPSVSDVAVVGVPDEKWGEVGAAFVVPTEGNTPLIADLREFLCERLARYKIPRHIYMMRELPRTTVGKIARLQLVEEFTRMRNEND